MTLGTITADEALVAALDAVSASYSVVGTRRYPDVVPEDAVLSGPFIVYRIHDPGEDVAPIGVGIVAQDLTYDLEWLCEGESLDPVKGAVDAASTALDGYQVVAGGRTVTFSRLSELRLSPAVDRDGRVWSRTGLRFQVLLMS